MYCQSNRSNSFSPSWAQQESPTAHVLGFVLHPVGRDAGLVWFEGVLQGRDRQRVELLDTDDGDIAASELGPLGQQIVVDPARTEQQPLHDLWHRRMNPR